MHIVMTIDTINFQDFMWRALFAGVGIAIFAAPLGCLMVWRRMAYLSDTLSHAALLGVAIGFFLKLPIPLGILGTAFLVAMVLWLFRLNRGITTDTLLTILTHASLALGLVLISLVPTARLDLMSYLVGDILTVTVQGLIWIYVGGIGILVGVTTYWQTFITTTVHEELALIEGVPVAKTRFILLLLMAVFVAISMQFIGVLLLSALLIIPAATARFLARTPEQMVLFSAVAGIISVVIGLLLSLLGDLPAGPSIALVSSFLFTVTYVYLLLRA